MFDVSILVVMWLERRLVRDPEETPLRVIPGGTQVGECSLCRDSSVELIPPATITLSPPAVVAPMSRAPSSGDSSTLGSVEVDML